jgi:ABC-type molybdate transport system ATPase subunit
MYARLGFSVAAHLEPDILVIDEVLSVGDSVFQAKGVEKMRAIVHGGATVIFVSHDLHAVTDLCSRSLLLSHGRLIEDGPTSQVIHAYMEQIRAKRSHLDDRMVIIEDIAVTHGGAPKVAFEAGERAVVEIKIRAIRNADKIACSLYLRDNNFYEVFQTSTEQLGLPSMSLRAGDRRVCRFEIDLHLASSTFHLCASLCRYDTEQVFDQVEPGATLLIHSPTDVRGSANLYPNAVILQ